MTDTMTFDVAAMQSASVHLGETVTGMGDILDRLDAETRALSAAWSGQAQQAYAGAHSSWSASMRRLTAIADEMRTVLDAATTGLDDTERANARRWPL